MSHSIEDIAHELARVQAEAALAPHGLWPAGEKETIPFAGNHCNRNGFAQLILAKYYPAIMERARLEYERRKAEGWEPPSNIIPFRSPFNGD